VVFSDLEDGEYIILANGPTMFEGQPIGISKPPGGVLQVSVQSGNVVPLIDAIVFHPILGRVIAAAVDAERQAGLQGVTFVLSRTSSNGRSNGQQQTPLTSISGPSGEASFDVVPPGEYMLDLEQDPITLAGGAQWTVAETMTLPIPVHVAGTDAVRVPEFRMIRDIHRIYGYVNSPAGTPVPNAVVIVQNQSGDILDTVNADKYGAYEWIAPRAGTYLLTVQDTRSGATMQRFPATVAKPVRMDLIAPSPPFPPPALFGPLGSGGGGGSGPSPNVNGNAQIRESALDLTAYPILTEEVSFPSSPTGGSVGPAAAGAPLSQIVDSALRDVLNWRPKATDPAGFSSALTQAFTLKDVEGHTQWTWTPRSYTVQTDLGAVTGAQASIYSRAKVALEQSLPLLDGLKPLIETVPAEDLDSMRVVIRSSLTQLVDEFGLLGGPRVERVDELFKLLLGGTTAAFPTSPDDVKGQLGRLRERFGLERFRVNTVDDEQDLTNYLILVDYVIGLAQSWAAQRAFFSGAPGIEPFLGTQLVLLSRDLEVVSELVRSAYFAMDSVFLGPAQRQTIKLDFTPDPSMFVEDLLEWVDRLASQEGPRLIQGAGKDGIFAFQPMITDLARFVSMALLDGTNGGKQKLNGTIPAAYGSPRVQRALQALARQLASTRDHSNSIAPPLLGDAAPDWIANPVVLSQLKIALGLP
jgi:hypothetical protein